MLPVKADEAVEKVVTQMFGEIERILAPLGRYIVVTLAQEQIVHKFLETFRNSNRFLIHVHKVDSDGSKSFSMPIFLFVATKLRAPMPVLPVRLFAYS